MSLRHIVVSDQNYNKLKDLGRAGDSFNDVIEELVRTRVQKPKESKIA